ncbi:hypothetical protein NM688_g4587 [Phlebia brevispora]|uniref:Uncharacterized protein n=1 Tax=Phlebia brevispora TaxID=194682 RepID=A0ACC1T2P0_9APHY|nr:hypothetical protein NM688_g4587 [Phlebia brevispora]
MLVALRRAALSELTEEALRAPWRPVSHVLARYVSAINVLGSGFTYATAVLGTGPETPASSHSTSIAPVKYSGRTLDIPVIHDQQPGTATGGTLRGCYDQKIPTEHLDLIVAFLQENLRLSRLQHGFYNDCLADMQSRLRFHEFLLEKVGQDLALAQALFSARSDSGRS